MKLFLRKPAQAGQTGIQFEQRPPGTRRKIKGHEEPFRRKHPARIARPVKKPRSLSDTSTIESDPKGQVKKSRIVRESLHSTSPNRARARFLIWASPSTLNQEKPETK